MKKVIGLAVILLALNTVSFAQKEKQVAAYVKAHNKGAKITEAGKVTNAHGKTFYEAEVKGKDIIFDEKGNFVKAEK